MIIKCLSEEYIDNFVEVVDEYREYCGFEKSQKNTKEFFQKLMEGNKAKTFIAISENEQVMGFINLYPTFSTLSLSNIWILNDLGVSRRFRKLGVASALIEEAIKFAEKSGAIRIELKTAIDNKSAQRLYSKIGFTVDNENIYYRVPLKQ